MNSIFFRADVPSSSSVYSPILIVSCQIHFWHHNW